METENDILNAPLWQKILAFAALITAAGWLLNSYVFSPKVKLINHNKKTLHQIEKELKAILGETVILKNGNEVQIKALKKELKKLSGKIPTEKEIPYLIGKFITEIGSGLDIDYSLIEPQTIVDEKKYRRVPLKVEFVSNLQDFYAYLSQLKNLPSTIRIDSLSLLSSLNNKITVRMEFSAFVMPGKTARSRETAGRAPAFEKNPFYVYTNNQKITGAVTAKASPTGLTLQGFWRGKNTKAFIDDNIVAVGDTINGYKLLAINRDNVVLTKKGKRYTLTLTKEE